MKRTYSIRTWLVGSIIGTAIMAYVGIFLFVVITDLWPRASDETPFVRDEEREQQLYRSVETAPGSWEDPAWQRNMKAEAQALELGVRIIRPGRGTIYESWQYPGTFRGRVIRTTEVVGSEGPVGTVYWHDLHLYGLSGDDMRWQRMQNLVIPTGGILIMLLTALGTVWAISRPILRPLRQLSEAAGQINRGTLDFAVPVSTVREVNEFAEAFDRMRDGLKTSLSQQAAMEQERRLFIASMAHDLRTPLTSVRGYLEGIRDGVASSPEKLERYLAVALDKTAAMERLVDGLFNYSRTEYLNQPPTLEPLVLGDLVVAAVRGIRPQAEAKGITLTIDEAPESCTVQGDRMLLNRVIDNLLDNALRHTPAGGTVAAGWRGGVEHCRIWVQDSGPGIAPEDLPRIFDPLYRADKARSTRTGGAGLGLAIAKRLVEAHGGSIKAENREGARFTVTLPTKT